MLNRKKNASKLLNVAETSDEVTQFSQFDSVLHFFFSYSPINSWWRVWRNGPWGNSGHSLQGNKQKTAGDFLFQVQVPWSFKGEEYFNPLINKQWELKWKVVWEKLVLRSNDWTQNHIVLNFVIYDK